MHRCLIGEGSLNLLSLMLANQGKKEEGGRCFTILLAVGGGYIALPVLTAFDVTLAGCDSILPHILQSGSSRPTATLLLPAGFTSHIFQHS